MFLFHISTHILKLMSIELQALQAGTNYET